MNDTPHVRKADRVAQDLLHRISTGRIEVGSVLPKEAELAEEYGVNRGVVREAIKLLEVHRLVRPVRRRGTIVLDPLQSLSPEVLAAMLRPAPGKLDPSVLGNLLEIRAELDVMMTRLAAERRTEENLAELEACLADIEAAGSDPEKLSSASVAMTIAVARCTQNVLFQMLAHWNRRVLQDLGHVMLDIRPTGGQLHMGMRAMVECIRHKKADQAARLVEGYQAWLKQRLLEAARNS